MSAGTWMSSPAATNAGVLSKDARSLIGGGYRIHEAVGGPGGIRLQVRKGRDGPHACIELDSLLRVKHFHVTEPE